MQFFPLFSFQFNIKQQVSANVCLLWAKSTDHFSYFVTILASRSIMTQGVRELSKTLVKIGVVQ